MESPILLTLGDVSRETRRMWEEISRVFVLSSVTQPGEVTVEFRVEGLGKFVLNSVESTFFFSCVSLSTDLTVLQIVILSNIALGRTLTTRVTKRWPT